MALHPDFPESPYAILDPAMRWFPADEALRESSSEKLMPPLVSQLRKKVKEWRDSGYVGATDASRSLLNWWFNTPHLLPQTDGTMAEFQYYFAQREALETIIYLYDVVGVQDKYDLMRFDSSGVVSAGMFDETWDVRNVTTIVGLRAYSAKSNILPEQTLGRGLRKMYPGGVEEYVSVVGTNAFMDFVESIVDEESFEQYKPTSFRQLVDGFREYKSAGGTGRFVPGEGEQACSHRNDNHAVAEGERSGRTDENFPEKI